MMKYPVRLSDDLKYLSGFYGWNAEDKKAIRESFTNCQDMVNFYINLAAAHRAGYSQGASNNYIRLQSWCLSKGLVDPFSKEFDVKKLDEMSLEKVEVTV